MTTQEFSTEFDILYNNISSNQAPGLDEYEKSVFLTRAQNQMVINLYSGKDGTNSFEITEELRRYLSSLVKTSTLTATTTTSQKSNGYHSNFTLPTDLWYIVYEAVTLKSEDACVNGKEIVVVPTTHDDYYKTAKNPFRGPTERRALRLDLENNTVEIVSKYPISSYLVRYISKPSPIILTDLNNLDSGLTIDKEQKEQTCTLHEALHFDILRTAVALAISSFNITMSSGKTSES
jgi:hypothetical protein